MGRKLKFIISDLHLGAGHSPDACNPLEDFTATQEFIAFLHQIVQESERHQSEVELIFNGDLFEFLQVPAADQFEPAKTYPSQAYLDSSEEASIQRLKLIVQGHSAIFDSLADFMHVEEPPRRITVIKGNHDVALFWPGVKSYLREVLGASGARASLLRFADEFVSREKIYVEHGHQRAEKINGYHDSFDPRALNDPSQLFYPAGSHFLINFFNQVEPQLPFVDQIKPLTALLWYAFEWNFDFACQATAQFIRHTALPGGPTPDLEPLLQELEDEANRAAFAERYLTDPAFRHYLHGRISPYFAEANSSSEEATVSEGLSVSEDPKLMGLACQQHQRWLLRRAAEAITEQEKARIIIFGHTHQPVQERLPNGSLYINTGSWTLDLSEASPESWAKLFAGEPAVSALRPSLTYARITYDEQDNPHGQLLRFSLESPKKSVSPVDSTPPVVLEPAMTPGFFERQRLRFSRFFGGQSLTHDA